MRSLFKLPLPMILILRLRSSYSLARLNIINKTISSSVIIKNQFLITSKLLFSKIQRHQSVSVIWTMVLNNFKVSQPWNNVQIMEIDKIISKYQKACCPMLRKASIKLPHINLPHINQKARNWSVKDDRFTSVTQKEEKEKYDGEKIQLNWLDSFQQQCRRKLASMRANLKQANMVDSCSMTVDMSSLNELNFPILSFTVQQIIELSVNILTTSQFCNLNFTKKVTKKMVSLIAKNYNKVSYHNFSHAFSLMLLSFQCFNRQFSLKYMFTDEQYFYILIAGLCHDLNHNGSTNDFEIKTKSKLAKEANNQSVLENMHLRQLWKMLSQNPDFDFVGVSNDKNRAKSIITRLILSTDMTFHNKIIQQFKNMRKLPNFDPKKNIDQKWSVIQLVFHGCDIGNACTSFDNYISWGVLLSHQFSKVARQEQQAGLQVSAYLRITDLKGIYKDQLWFVSSIVQPLWKQIAQTYSCLEPMLQNIEANLKRVKQEFNSIQSS